jgi:hypothetical protein
VIDQLKIALVAWHAIGVAALQDVIEHLVSFRPDNLNRAIAHAHRTRVRFPRLLLGLPLGW